MSVPRTRRISMKARKLFLSQNCMGVKIKLKKRLSTNGNAIVHGNFFLYARYNTVPKEMAMIQYNTVHTGQKIHEGGAHSGLSNVWYQEYVFISMNLLYPFR